MQKTKIALLYGGTSNEREVSLRSGAAVLEALDKQKYEIFEYDPKDQMQNFIKDAYDKKFELVLPILHGEVGEDGKLQGLLEILGIKYVFSGCLAQALSMNKNKAKIIAKAAGVPTAKSITINKSDNYNLPNIKEEIGLPVMVKPVSSGSSVGISKANSEEELTVGVASAFQHDEEVLIEKYIQGREFTVAVIGNKVPEAMPVVEILPQVAEFYDYRAKYEEGGSKHICPAELDEATTNKIQTLAIKVFKAIGCADLARVDFIMDEENNFYFIEINTIPGMTSVSLVPDSAQAVGLDFTTFLDRLIDSALEK
jgi:D-alanine-D-alanine ligase